MDLGLCATDREGNLDLLPMRKIQNYTTTHRTPSKLSE